MSEIPPTTAEHPSALNVGVLLQPCLHVTSEEHAQKIVKCNSSGNDVSSDDDRKEGRWVSGVTSVAFEFCFTIQDYNRVQAQILYNVSNDVDRFDIVVLRLSDGPNFS